MTMHCRPRLATGNLAMLVAALVGLASCGRIRLEPAGGGPDAISPADAEVSPDTGAADARVPADAPAPCVWTAFGKPGRAFGIEGDDDWLGSVSEDGVTLVVDRYSFETLNDLFIAGRSSAGEPFGTAVAIDELNSAAQDSTGVLLRGGLEIYFASGREPTPSSGLWRASRATADGAFEPPSPVEELNAGGDAHEHTLTPDGLTVYFTSTRPGSASSDIWFAERSGPDAPFSKPQLVPELNTDSVERAPGISADGLEIFFASERPDGIGELDLWRATRPSLDQPFGPPENVTELNTANDEVFPRLSADGSILYFNYDTETAGDLNADVWEARRQCLRP
jgi:hypothetical protein